MFIVPNYVNHQLLFFAVKSLFLQRFNVFGGKTFEISPILYLMVKQSTYIHTVRVNSSFI